MYLKHISFNFITVNLFVYNVRTLNSDCKNHSAIQKRKKKARKLLSSPLYIAKTSRLFSANSAKKTKQ